jgi:hypothetical protein
MTLDEKSQYVLADIFFDNIYTHIRNSVNAVTHPTTWFEVHDDLQLLITIAIEDTQVALRELTEDITDSFL